MAAPSVAEVEDVVGAPLSLEEEEDEEEDDVMELLLVLEMVELLWKLEVLE